jgi:hypothetical protein
MKAILRNSYTRITDKPLAPVGPSHGGRAVSEVDIEKLKMMREQIKQTLAVVREDYEYMQEELDDISEHLAETERRLEGKR